MSSAPKSRRSCHFDTPLREDGAGRWRRYQIGAQQRHRPPLNQLAPGSRQFCERLSVFLPPSRGRAARSEPWDPKTPERKKARRRH